MELGQDSTHTRRNTEHGQKNEAIGRRERMENDGEKETGSDWNDGEKRDILRDGKVASKGR